ncbi:MAG TPA: hypothetical protein VF072_15375 [Thermoleophilaceae bacterium]
MVVHARRKRPPHSGRSGGTHSENNTFLLTDWITHTPPDVLAKNFGVSEAAFAKVPPNLEQ